MEEGYIMFGTFKTKLIFNTNAYACSFNSSESKNQVKSESAKLSVK